MNDRICKQRELLVKKEGKFYSNSHDFQDRINSLPFEAGQNVWLQNSDSRKYEAAVICEKSENPTPTWLRFQQLDSASEETATSSSQGRVGKIPILHTLS